MIWNMDVVHRWLQRVYRLSITYAGDVVMVIFISNFSRISNASQGEIQASKNPTLIWTFPLLWYARLCYNATRMYMIWNLLNLLIDTGAPISK